MTTTINGVQQVNPLTDEERAVTERATHALIEVTDVGDGPAEFDALSTIITRHLRPLQDQIFRMTEPGILKYAADFASRLPDMAYDRLQRVEEAARMNNRALPADYEIANDAWRNKTVRWVNNYNPRNQRASEHANGRIPHLALSNGVEIYAVPPNSLQYLRTCGSLDALFRVPPSKHPLFPEGEQFTSSVFGKTAHEAPEHLQLVWRKGMSESLLDGVVPKLEQAEVAFIDNPYHNRRVITPSLQNTLEQLDESQQSDGTVLIQIGHTRLRVFKANCLADVPDGEWGIWHNPADVEENNGAGYIEVSRRWNVGKDWKGRGQFPSNYLAPHDRIIGAKFSILPKDSRRRFQDIFRSSIANCLRIRE